MHWWQVLSLILIGLYCLIWLCIIFKGLRRQRLRRHEDHLHIIPLPDHYNCRCSTVERDDDELY